MLKQLTILLCALLLSACGFKLRGFSDVPVWLNHVAIVIQNTHHDLRPMFKEQFQSYGIQVTEQPIKANFLLILEKELEQQQITNISASTTPRQYQLTYSLQYSLLNKKTGLPLISSRIVSVSRQLTVNNDRILGSDAESTIIMTEMRRDAVMQILGRLSRLQADK